MTNSPRDSFWDLLNSFEDYIDGGVKRTHPAPAPRRAAGMDAAPTPRETAAGEGALPGTLKGIAETVRECRRCGLCETRNRTVPGTGAENPLVMIIGEGPGAEEDRQGLPFVGKAGQYLDKWLASIALDRRTNCFIGNIVKCRPPGNRDPLPEESEACLPYLRKQIELLRPRSILTLGRIAAQILLESEKGIGKLRGQFYTYQGIPLLPTYHPSAVLRSPELRAPVWEDLKSLRDRLAAGPHG